MFIMSDISNNDSNGSMTQWTMKCTPHLLTLSSAKCPVDSYVCTHCIPSIRVPTLPARQPSFLASSPRNSTYPSITLPDQPTEPNRAWAVSFSSEKEAGIQSAALHPHQPQDE